MRVLISGAGGLIGGAVSRLLRERGHEASALARDPRRAKPGDVPWQPQQMLEPAKLAPFDAIVHLAGRPLATRWTESIKAEIRNSRVAATALLAQAVARAFQQSGRPQALICASAMGYYGSRGDEELTEESAPGQGFLAGVCRDWEAAAQPAADAGLRVAHMRTGLVLSSAGGALETMLHAFRKGVGGALGSGQQWVSWATLEDAARAYVFAVENPDSPKLQGALNLSSPHPVTNAEFTRTLAHVLHRPALARVPAWLLRRVAGELANEMLLASQRMAPRRLLEAGFQFEDTELEPTLRKLLE